MSNFINAEHARIFEDTAHIPGPQVPGDTEKLYELGYLHGDVILEVGTYFGRSATAILRGALANPRRRRTPQYFGIDIDSGSMSTTFETLQSERLDRYALLFLGDLATFAKKISIAPTMAFIDGDHSYGGLRRDTAALSEMLRPNMPVLFHDYLNSDNDGAALGVRKAVDEWIAEQFARIEATPGVSCFVTTTEKCKGSHSRMSRIRFARSRGLYNQEPPEPPRPRERLPEKAKRWGGYLQHAFRKHVFGIR